MTKWNEEVKSFWKSKTLWINVLAIVGAVCTAFSGELTTAGTLTLVAVVNIVLRIVTKTKLG